MNAAFDQMLDILNESSDDDSSCDSDNEFNPQLETDVYNDELQTLTLEIGQMTAPTTNITPRHEMIEIVEFDHANNVLNPDIRANFKAEKIYMNTHIFTQPISTTNTVEGFISNVSFHERDLIEELLPDENIVMYRCNYGKIKHDGYTEPVKERKTNRGRKKKPKKKKARKRQGEGSDFNSQVTFVVRSESANLIRTTDANTGETIYQVPYGAKVYKFKVFRTGKVQLPGVCPEHVDDVIISIKKVVTTLNFHLHPGETNPARISDIININPVMKNYKFRVKLPLGHIIDMNSLRRILRRERTTQCLGDADIIPDDPNVTERPSHPDIFMIKYTQQDSKLSIKFTTPIYHNPDKRTRVNIFGCSGKINILGALDADVSFQICEYMHWIFETFYAEIIVGEGTLIVPPVHNIAQFTDDEFTDQINLHINYIPPVPEITDEDYRDVIEFISVVYQEQMDIANQYILELFGPELLAF